MCYRGLCLMIVMLASLALAAEPEPKAKPKEKAKPNRLANESSPYLLQHAYNPVDWHAWNADTLAKAKKANKLIFLSIGYSSCHWCHVMERESFSDEGIAKTLNENFICIKVDREERPDIDEIYMTASQALGSSGGWPLSMFLTPEGKPIFGGTYWPPEDKKFDDETVPGFKSVLKKVLEFDKDKRADLIKQGDAVAEMTVQALDRATIGLALVKLDPELIKAAVSEFDIDPEHGGFGNKARRFAGTKFPRVSGQQFLLEQGQKKENAETAKLIRLTLDSMAQGGIYDHLGGGFHRYSTERTWTIPHFEKMLYDQAQLVELYASAQKLQPNPAYERTIRETLDFVLREMTAPEGYFYSALDADSNEKEGEFYVWTPKELDDLLGKSDDAELFKKLYASGGPNFEKKYIILRLSRSLGETAKELKLTEPELVAKLAPSKKKLFDARAKRERPFLDTKLIVAWNGQMIAAFAKAGKCLVKPVHGCCETAARFLQKHLYDQAGRLLRIYAARPGEKPTARGPSFLDDHAYLTHGYLVLHDATKKPEWLKAAESLADATEKWFGDERRGGYFGTASDGEKLFARGKDGYDGAQPSGNGVMCRNLARLWELTKKDSYLERAEKVNRLYARALQQSPTAVPILAGTTDRLLAAGKLSEKPAPKLPEPPANPKNSADVVMAEIKADPEGNEVAVYRLTLRIAKGWHLYARPSGRPDLAESEVSVEFLQDGVPVKEAKVIYPKGMLQKDKEGDYSIYEGETVIRIEVPVAKREKLSVKLKLSACDEKKCLMPATIRLDVK